MSTYLRPASISYTGIQTDFGAGSIQAVDWHFWSTYRSAIQTVRANDCEIINYCEPPRLTPGLGGNPTAASFYTPPGQPYSLTGWTNAGWLYKGTEQRPNPHYSGSYAGDLSARNGLTGTDYMQHIVQWCCDRANDPDWGLDGFFLDSVGNDSMSGAFSGWAAGEAADFNEGGAILAIMVRAALGDDAILVNNNFWTSSGYGPDAAKAVNGLCNEHHDDAPTGTGWLANDYARCTNAKRRIIHIPGSTGCSGANADVGSLVTHVAINQPSGANYTMASDPGTCSVIQNGTWPADAGHIHLMDSTTWGASPSGATGGAGGTTTVTVTVSPSAPSVQTGDTQQFTATLTGSTATPAWKVNGTTGGDSTVGTITTAGLYTAPASVPTGGSVTVSAVLSTGESGSATVSITSPPATLPAHPTITDSAFGNTFSGTIQNVMTPDYVRGVFATAPEDGTVASLQVGVDGLGTGTGTQKFTARIYSAAVGSPLLASSSEVTVTADDAAAWVQATLTDTLDVTAGESVYLCIHSGGSGDAVANFYRNTTSGVSLSLADTYSDGGAASLEGATTGDADISIYAEYTAASAATITVTVTPGTVSLHVGTSKLFTATITGSTNKPTWTVNDISGGNSVVGTIDSSGLYTAPLTVPSTDTVTVAASVDGTSDSATVTISAPITVTVTPDGSFVRTDGTIQFTATVSDDSDVSAWSVNGVDTGSADTGTITSSGLYTPPATVPSRGYVTVSAAIATGEAGSATLFIIESAAARGVGVISSGSGSRGHLGVAEPVT